MTGTIWVGADEPTVLDEISDAAHAAKGAAAGIHYATLSGHLRGAPLLLRELRDATAKLEQLLAKAEETR